MLFCPFCGEPIVIPEQDTPEVAGQEADPEPVGPTVPSDASEIPEPSETNADASGKAEEPQPSSGEEDAAAELLNWGRERREQVEDEWARKDDGQESFSPLKLEENDDSPGDWREEISRKKKAVELEKKPPLTQRDGDSPVRLEGAAPRLNSPKGDRASEAHTPVRKRANTLVPPKTMDPDDIFMDGKGVGDELDPYDDNDTGGDGFEEDFVFEDEEESSFFMRHLRGIVGLALFAILILMFVIYALTRAGQLTLAQANLAWRTEAYSTLGSRSYQEGRFDEAGLFYERALQRSPNNYNYASSAAMAYNESGNLEKATEMLKRCVQIDPTKLEPYAYLLKLYPEAASRPWEITQLLQQGYQRTGDKRLNVTG